MIYLETNEYVVNVVTNIVAKIPAREVKDLSRQVAYEFRSTIFIVTHGCRFIDGVDKPCEIREGKVFT